LITVLIADDHPIVRQGVASLLNSQPDISVVGEAIDGLSASQLVEQLQPTVLLLDMMMPGISGLDLIPVVGRRSSGTRVLPLSMQSDETIILEALKAGAAGYFLKSCPSEDLVNAVRTVAAGGRYLSAPLNERLIFMHFDRASQAVEDPYDNLTLREREVLHLAAEGFSNPQIAERLFISGRTAEHHRASVMHKLGIKTSTELVRFAIRRRILSIDG
jgi:DNA-binding NarL/FixJ family response regulator